MLHNRRYIFVLILMGLISALSGILGNIASGVLPEVWKPYLWLAWPLFFIFALAGIGLAIWQAYVEGITIPPEPDEASEPVSWPAVGNEGEWFFAHPYPLQENFTGRVRERQMLTEWLTEREQPLLALTAIGGMGKSALTWAWLQRDVLGQHLPDLSDDPPPIAEAVRPEGGLWWSFYEPEANFDVFLNTALTRLNGQSVDTVDTFSTRGKVQALVNRLQQRRFLLILDGFERELRAHASLPAAYQEDKIAEDDRGDFRTCINPHAANFLHSVAALPLQSRVLLTSRLFPRELDNLAGCQRIDLAGLDPDDAITFFQAQGVRGTRVEIRAACAPYGYHPLALRLLTGLIIWDKQMPGDVQVAGRHSVLPELKEKEQHHILQVAYDALDRKKRTLLSSISACRSPVNYEALSIFNKYRSDEQFDAALAELIDRGLLFFDRKRGCYDLHPVVRGYAYACLPNKERVHNDLRGYFSTILAREQEKVHNIEDLTPTIEYYHHTVRAGHYKQAAELYGKRLDKPLFFRLGAYQTCIELLQGLFPDGEDHPPRLKARSDQIWALITLANAYIRSGQPRHAVPLLEMSNAIGERLSRVERILYVFVNRHPALFQKLFARHFDDLITGLGSLATQQILLGELAAADRNLQRRIQLCHKIGTEYARYREAVARQELSRLLAYRGAFDEASQEWNASHKFNREANDIQGQCVDWAYRALYALLRGQTKVALKAADRARKIATSRQNERDRIWAEWLMGRALVTLASKKRNQTNDRLAKAEVHLTEALTRCRRTDLVDLEADILLVWAGWHRSNGDVEQARQHAEEARNIANRCKYRLIQADVYNLLARLALETDDKETTRRYAQKAQGHAWCDGPPYCYKPALEAAESILKDVGVESR